MQGLLTALLLAVSLLTGQDRPTDPAAVIRERAAAARHERSSFRVQGDMAAIRAAQLVLDREQLARERLARARAAAATQRRTPPRTDPGTGTPPPAGPWVDPTTLGNLGPLPAQLGVPPPLWGTMLDQLPALLFGVEISAQAQGSPVIPCKVEGAHQGKLVWRRVRVQGAPGPDGKSHARWAWRAFDVFGFEVTECEFREIHDEHGCYWNTVGGFVIRRCLFFAMGSQAIQVAGAKPGTARAGETGLGAKWQETVDAKRWEWQVVEECAAIECGYNPQRASYALSFFGDVPNPVRIARCFIQTTTAFHPDTSGAICDSYGAVMAHNRLRFELLESALLYKKGDRDTLQLWGIGDGDPTTIDIHLRGSEILGRGVDIRMVKPGDCQILIEGCTGGAPVTVSTEPFNVLGPLPPKPESILYKGGVGADWTNLTLP